MKKLSALLIDDEALSRKSLQKQIETVSNLIEIIADTDSAESGIQLINIHKPDIVFLDIEMPRMNGFTMLEQLDQRDFEVIFTTAYNHYAINAIRFSALDYLVKPIDSKELKNAIEQATTKRLSGNYNKRLETLLHNIQNPSTENKKIAIASLEGIEFIQIDDIEYLEASSNYTHIHTLNQKFIASKNLHHFEEILPPGIFFRIHHSYLINMNKIQKYVRGDGGQVVMMNGKTLDVSRRRKDEFLRMIKL